MSILYSYDPTRASFWITFAARVCSAIVLGIIWRVARSPRRVRNGGRDAR